MNNPTDNVSELKSPFEQLREVDAEGKEWWNSRKLARVMGYGKYWNFERVMEKAMAWTSQKGYTIAEHFREIREMAELFGVTQQDISFHLQQINDSGELHLSDGYKKYLYGSEKWSDEAMYNLDVVIAVGYRVNSYEALSSASGQRVWPAFAFLDIFPYRVAPPQSKKANAGPIVRGIGLLAHGRFIFGALVRETGLPAHGDYCLTGQVATM